MLNSFHRVGMIRLGNWLSELEVERRRWFLKDIASGRETDLSDWSAAEWLSYYDTEGSFGTWSKEAD